MSADFATISSLPRDETTGPVFRRPWEIAFAIALVLHQQGLFTWPEWAKALSSAHLRRASRGRF